MKWNGIVQKIRKVEKNEKKWNGMEWEKWVIQTKGNLRANGSHFSTSREEEKAAVNNNFLL